ncbi:MAG: hypothetical protein JXR63_01980 [Spirochaetales bacterium]|nr:hypothetical protein [Spirochaetales bacterium]
MRKILKVSLSLALLSLVFSCGTRIEYTRLRPSPVNMVDCRNIAIFNVAGAEQQYTFDSWAEAFVASLFGVTNDVDPMKKRIGEYATDKLTNVLYATNYFAIVPASTVEQAAKSMQGQNFANSDLGTLLGVDAIVEGSIHRLEYTDERFVVETTRTLEDGTKVTQKTNKLKRTFHIHMSYNVIKTANRQILAGASINTSESQVVTISPDTRYPRDYEYLDGYYIYTKYIDSLIKTLRYQIAPTAVPEIRYLKKDKTKNEEMARADKLAKGKLYDQAYQVYRQIWDATSMYEAGYNAALLLEAQMKFQEAKALLEAVIQKYPEKEAMDALRELNKIIAEQKRVEEQF